MARNERRRPVVGTGGEDDQVLEEGSAPSSVLQEREILDRAQAAEFLGISLATLDRRREIPRHKLGAVPRFVRSELVAYVLAQGSS